jgi:hypothetical protein
MTPTRIVDPDSQVCVENPAARTFRAGEPKSVKTLNPVKELYFGPRKGWQFLSALRSSTLVQSHKPIGMPVLPNKDSLGVIAHGTNECFVV